MDCFQEISGIRSLFGGEAGSSVSLYFIDNPVFKDAEGNEFGVDGAIGIDSAVIIEINSSIDSIEYTPPPPNTGI